MKANSFGDVVLNHPLIHRMKHEGCTPESMVVALFNEREALLGELMHLQSICPKKVTADGVIYIWHCPDHLIPEDNAKAEVTQ